MRAYDTPRLDADKAVIFPSPRKESMGPRMTIKKQPLIHNRINVMKIALRSEVHRLGENRTQLLLHIRAGYAVARVGPVGPSRGDPRHREKNRRTHDN